MGSLKSNDLGLFDMHGNAWEWCQDAYVEQSVPGGDGRDKEDITDTNIRVMRGGSFSGLASSVRSANRLNGVPATRSIYGGFRPARTFTP